MSRSSSGSHIPLPKSVARVRSKSAARTSITDVPSSASKVRTGSCDRLTGTSLKRTNSSSNLKKSIYATPTLAATSSTAKRSVGLTPTLGFSSFKRSTSNLTPNSVRSRSRSPFKVGSERTVNDKKWVSEQFAKVKRFLQEHESCPEHIPDMLKPPAIGTFVFVINLLLKEIDPHIEINNVTYKEIVMSMLKMLHYPGNISNSLLKTANTMHSWPQIISIFAWLVDLITTIKRVDQPVSSSQQQDLQYQKIECVTSYIVERYCRFNSNEEIEDANRAFVESFAKIVNIDEEEMKRLEEEVTNLSQLKEQQMKSIAEQKIKSDEVKKQTDNLQNEINMFYTNMEEKQEDINCALNALRDRTNKLVEAVKAKEANLAKMTETIKFQSCTVEEKKQILKHIDEMKHTIELEKQKIKAQKSIKENCDLKLIAARKKVETETYRLNNSLMKLALLEPGLKILQLKEIDFLSPAFKAEVQRLSENIAMFETKFNSEIAHLTSEISKTKTKISVLKEQKESAQKTIQTLIESEQSLSDQIELCNKDMDAISVKRQEQKQLFLQKIDELKQVDADLSRVKQKLAEVTQLKNEKAAHLEVLKEQSLAFFVRVHDIVMGNLVKMNEIRNDLFETCATALAEINKTQDDILADLEQLRQLKK